MQSCSETKKKFVRTDYFIKICEGAICEKKRIRSSYNVGFYKLKIKINTMYDNLAQQYSCQNPNSTKTQLN